MKKEAYKSIERLNNFLLEKSISVPMFSDVFDPQDESLLPCLADEQLLALYHFGNDNALAELEVRYYLRRNSSVHLIFPTGKDSLDDCAISQAFFTAIYSSVRNYCWKARFQTFFHAVFRNELIREIKNEMRSPFSSTTISLDTTSDEEDRPLYESIPGPALGSDPVPYARFRTIMDDLKHLPPDFDPMTPKVAALLANGFHANEIGDVLHLTNYRVRCIVDRLREYLIQKYDLSPSKKKIPTRMSPLAPAPKRWGFNPLTGFIELPIIPLRSLMKDG